MASLSLESIESVTIAERAVIVYVEVVLLSEDELELSDVVESEEVLELSDVVLEGESVVELFSVGFPSVPTVISGSPGSGGEMIGGGPPTGYGGVGILKRPQIMPRGQPLESLPSIGHIGTMIGSSSSSSGRLVV